MNRSTIELKGTRELLNSINKLPFQLQKSAEVAVLRAGAKPINKAAKGKVPSDSGLLKKSLGINVAKVKGITSARVGARKGWRSEVVRNGKKVIADPSKYSHLVEYGTSHSSAKPFIRPAVESSQSQVLAAMAEGYDKYLDRVVKRIRSRK